MSEIIKGVLDGHICDRPYEQSANVFFHCMRKMKYLKEILKEQAIYPRYNIENVSYLQLNKYDNIGIPMICFCDIYITKLKSHIKKYGGYGIGLEKKPEIEDKLTPILYVNESSYLFNDFQEALEESIDQIMNDKEMPLYDYIIHQLLYTKPLRGVMKIEGKEKNMIFHDEREWRFIPDMNDTELAPVIFDKNFLTKENLDVLNGSLRLYDNCKMKFNLSNIKYILVPNERNRDSMIRFVEKKLPIETFEKYRLISKLITFDEIEDDL